ncbi:hypothetical protein N7535_003133 [Penicillium sp. DV-2018c]|nr:hypothetical protein N7461_001175 [Penicillium sp. DV-2018c]KAJ5576207.1 hypothetical protein N7535_003133 [Penicillium sp. DV-2018c]
MAPRSGAATPRVVGTVRQSARITKSKSQATRVPLKPVDAAITDQVLEAVHGGPPVAPRPDADQLPEAGPVVKSDRIVTKGTRQAKKEIPSEQIEAAIADQVLEPVYGEPPAWAECRQQLCDALPWIRITQGAMYHNGGFCWGFLVDADGGTRTHIDEEIIITRIGGGCTKDAMGNLTLTKNQDSDSSLVQSITTSMVSKLPVGMPLTSMKGSKNQILNRDLPHRYNVMSFFRVTNVWFERIGNKHGAKVRFEKSDLAEKSWWAAKDSPPPMPLELRDFETKPKSLKCGACSKESIQIYEDGWMCLEPECVRFWKIGNNVAHAELTFDASFLNFRCLPDPEIRPHFSLVPNLLSTLEEDATTCRMAWKGIVCPVCHKCVRRTFWQGWKCSDDIGTARAGEVCAFQKFINMKPISLRNVVDDFELAPIKRALNFEQGFMVPEIDDSSLFPYRKLTHKLDGVGSITHFVANKEINGRSKGPDDLFVDLQREDIGLKRFPLSNSLVAGTLTAHFAVNYGSPYKYIVSVLSRAFDEAPDAILRALGRLSWATEQAVLSSGDSYMPPNELLTLGYFEEMKIGYHDDGESSLGPTIATLSLGGKSTMLIRMKYKYFNGVTRRADKTGNLLEDDPVLKGCLWEDERRALKQEFEAGKISRPEYDSSRHRILAAKRGKEAPAAIKLELHHGDLVVMHGENLQRYFEHSVVPESQLRFALTARYVKPEHVDEAEINKGDFSLTPEQIYDGK